MPRQEVDALLLKLAVSADQHSETRQNNIRRQATPCDIAPYIAANVWPGRNFALVGNSFYVERNVAGHQFAMKRAACIAMMLEQAKHTRRCVYLSDALQNEGFLEVLSRFERDWLSRLAPGTVIGPAYNARGELLGQSFSVWRADVSLVLTP